MCGGLSALTCCAHEQLRMGSCALHRRDGQHSAATGRKSIAPTSPTSFPAPPSHPRYIRTHIADSDHELPADSIYRAFPRLVNELTRTVFSGTTWERATPVERFTPGLATAVLSTQPPRCERDEGGRMQGGVMPGRAGGWRLEHGGTCAGLGEGLGPG